MDQFLASLPLRSELPFGHVSPDTDVLLGLGAFAVPGDDGSGPPVISPHAAEVQQTHIRDHGPTDVQVSGK